MTSQDTLQAPPVSLTPAAIEALAGLRQESPVPRHYVLLVTVRGGGCAGWSYGLDFVHPQPEVHFLIDVGCHTLAIDRAALPMLRGLEVDWVDDGLNHGFVFRNPNAAQTCGCGSSFSTRVDPEAA